MCSNNAERFTAWGFAVAVLVFCGTGQANQLTDIEQSKVAATVGEMLAIDTRIALKKEQLRELEAMGLKHSGSSSAQAIQPVPKMTPVHEPDKPDNTKPLPEKPQVPALSVEGIFGPGDQLAADVLIDGRKVRFKTGQRYPIGYDRSFAYQLISINVPCIRVSGPSGSQKLCVDGVQEN